MDHKHSNQEATSTMTIGSAPSSTDRAATQGRPTKERTQWVPPRWFIHAVWIAHRGVHRFTGGRRGLQTPKAGAWGILRLTTTGRQSGKQRSAMLGYLEEGPSLFTLAMNGWGQAEPAWWLNLQAQPDVTVELRDGKRAVRARAAHGEERERLWARFRAQREWGSDVDALALRRPGETTVVVFEPRS
jgi:deazaflavin-dependent oxidoreductase (nitroreductase family)